MKTLILGAALAILAAAPLAIAADRGDPQQSGARVTDPAQINSMENGTVASLVEAPRWSLDQPQFIGRSKLHNGLLPNGLLPNPPTYG